MTYTEVSEIVEEVRDLLERRIAEFYGGDMPSRIARNAADMVRQELEDELT